MASGYAIRTIRWRDDDWGAFVPLPVFLSRRTKTRCLNGFEIGRTIFGKESEGSHWGNGEMGIAVSLIGLGEYIINNEKNFLKYLCLSEWYNIWRDNVRLCARLSSIDIFEYPIPPPYSRSLSANLPIPSPFRNSVFPSTTAPSIHNQLFLESTLVAAI